MPLPVPTSRAAPTGLRTRQRRERGRCPRDLGDVGRTDGAVRIVRSDQDVIVRDDRHQAAESPGFLAGQPGGDEQLGRRRRGGAPAPRAARRAGTRRRGLPAASARPRRVCGRWGARPRAAAARSRPGGGGARRRRGSPRTRRRREGPGEPAALRPAARADRSRLTKLRQRRKSSRPEGYDPAVQQYELSRLPTGERLISERVPSVRSVVARLLDRRRLARRDRRARGRLALHRAPALQGHGHALGAGDRRDLRRARRRAERGHLARDDARLRARTRRPARAGARRDGRHGLRADLRRARLRARGRARGDRDGRGQPAGPRPRRRRRGGLRRPPARAAGDRARRGDLDRQPARARGVPPRRVRRREHRRRRRRERRRTSDVRRAARRRGCRRRRRPARRAAQAALTRAAGSGLPLPAQGRPSSTTSASARPGISRRDDRRFAASLLDSILGGSASSRLFQEIREKRGMAYSVYSFASQYSDAGQVGLYVGTREENLVECFEIVARELGDIAGRQRARRRARAGEGEPQGPHPALDRVDVEPDEPARQVADHRHRAALARRDHRADRRGRAPTTSPSSPATCCGSTASRRPGSGRARRASRGRVQRVNPALVGRSGRMKVFLLGTARQGRVGARRPRSRRRGTSWSSPPRGAERGGRLHAPGGGRGERPRLPRGRRARASSARPASTRSASRRSRRVHELPVFFAPNFALGAVLMMRFAAEAGKLPAARRDRRAPPRDEARRALRHREGDRGAAPGRDADPLRAPARASSRTRR